MSSEIDPCLPETTANECANAWCDERLADLPKRQRVRLIAVEPDGMCFVEFPTGAKGFVVADGEGFTTTEAPCVEIPVANTYATDPTTGEVLYDDCGVPVRTAHPGWENIIITDENGCQNRLGGLDGIPATLTWDGTKFVLDPTETTEGTTDLSDLQIFNGDCDTYNAVFRTEQVCSPTEGLKTVATLGYQTTPRIPCGSIMMFGGPDSVIPDGWVKCDGGNLSITDYECLYNVIGTTYGGAGNNFQVPDMRRRIPLGIAPAADPLSAITLGDTESAGGASAGAGTFLSDYQTKAQSASTSMDNLPTSGTIPATFDSVASGITQVTGNFTFTPPVGATHLVLNSWLLVACNLSQHSARATIKIDAPNYVPAVPDGPANVLINATYAGVDDAEATGAVAEGVGGRYDIPIRPNAEAVTVTEAVPTIWPFEINFDVSTPMIAYYGYEIWQQGFRMASTSDSGDETIGLNYIIYAGAAASCTNG